MTRIRRLSAADRVGVMMLAGCGTPPGQPRAGSVPRTPDEVVDFSALVRDNCAGCHGPEGAGGAAIALANPVYLAIADERAMRETIDSGVRGTSMPAFAQRAGGMLTDKQIDALVAGIRARWSRPGVLDGAMRPPTPRSRRATRHGEAAYQTFCESCHGPEVRAGQREAPSRTTPFWRWSAIRGCAHRHRRPARARRPGLARQRTRQADVGTGGHRRGELAGLAPSRNTGEAGPGDHDVKRESC